MSRHPQDHSLEEVFQVDAYVASYKVDTEEGHARRLFVQKVYSVLAIAVVITLFNGLLVLFLGQQYVVSYHIELKHVQKAELINIIVAICLCLTFLNWCAASYVGLQIQTDLTAHLLLCWSAQLLWFFLLIGLWLFVVTIWRWALVSWTTVGLLLFLLQLTIHTQMVGGGGGNDQQLNRKRRFTFTSNQLLLATLSLYMDSLLIFTLLTPVTGAVVSTLQQVTASAVFKG